MGAVRWIIYVVLLVGLIGALVWGYQEQQEKNAVLIKAENNYQRAFHDLSYRVDTLNEKIDTVLAMNAPDNVSPQMTDIWKITSEAKADVSQLPLTLVPFNKTEQFLNNIGEFAYRVSIRGLDDDPLSEDEINTLSQLQDQSNEIRRDLRTIQHEVLSDGVRWMDVEVMLATNEPREDSIINGLQTVERNAESYDTFDDSVGLSSAERGDQEVEIDGEEQTEEDIREIIRDYFELNNEAELVVTETGEGSVIPMYNASFDTEDLHGYAEITRQGGHVLSYLLSRDLDEANISLHDGMNEAQQLLEDLDFDDVKMVESIQYDKVGVYEFVHEQDDILYYPDSIQVKVALDEGDIIGLTAKDYVFNEQTRTGRDFEATLSEEEATEHINQSLEVREQRLAVIENDLGEEVLAYEILGTIDSTTYRVFINADDGFEERVERLKQSEEVYN
ncbi:germination protein YpeB [Alkalibacillus haloalkaliphilus]|uniref:germination protein YpeB n=1 Tax=Alkalibacillus haloalkaliphilus TaxID=94136 RepID=UPI002936AE5B|nr:germination protein YpeB [Alkalibacillus haloalkaliphilus]MDV2580843.1 germination protein YpeB [Alkalibacillus haloalkaliphilus]